MGTCIIFAPSIPVQNFVNGFLVVDVDDVIVAVVVMDTACNGGYTVRTVNTALSSGADYSRSRILHIQYIGR